ALRHQDEEPFKHRWLRNVDEGHEMHALVLGLIKQFGNPPFVIANVADGFQMLQQAADHAGHGGDGFQNNGPVPIALAEECIRENAHEFDQAIGELVTEALRLVVFNDALWNIGLSGKHDCNFLCCVYGFSALLQGHGDWKARRPARHAAARASAHRHGLWVTGSGQGDR
ncbi:MAG: hypothetical protein V2I51_22940, partial [Anderseniella sp.]|nr:hypothetical protein [Anderseniella sp.]